VLYDKALGIDPKDEFVREQKSRILKRLGKQSVVQPTAKVPVWVFN